MPKNLVFPENFHTRRSGGHLNQRVSKLSGGNKILQPRYRSGAGFLWKRFILDFFTFSSAGSGDVFFQRKKL